MSRPDTNDFSAIFLRDTPMMDTRAPLEYAKGAFPHTVSLPLMTDAERAKVGTCYKQQGQDEAIKLGHELVSGAVKEARVQKWLAFAAANPSRSILLGKVFNKSVFAQPVRPDKIMAER